MDTGFGLTMFTQPLYRHSDCQLSEILRNDVMMILLDKGLSMVGYCQFYAGSFEYPRKAGIDQIDQTA